MPAGDISFPGITAPQSLVATRTVGVRPDTAILYAQPQPGSPDCSGTATLEFGFNGTNITWTNALCDRGTLAVTVFGHRQIFKILDRRWSWSKAYFTQAFNMRLPDGSIEPSTQYTIAQIADELFSWLGVTADLSLVTSTELPEIVFDRHRVDDALDTLLTNRGYVISLMLDDTVKVYPRGTGVPLPDNYDLRNASVTIDPPEVPLYLTVCGARTMIQSKLRLIAVGIDLDGQIKPADMLSYAPAGGWAGKDLEQFGFIADQKTKDLCLLAIGKWYQIDTQADGTQDINFGGTNYSPGYITIDNASQLLPLEPRLLDATEDSFGILRSNPPFLEGTVFDGDAEAQPPRGENTPAFTRIDARDWDLDRLRGIVKLKSTALMKTPGPVAGVLTFADLYLTCCYSVHHAVGFVKDRYIRARNLGGIGEDLHKLDELERQIILSYTPGSGTVSGLSDNISSLNTEADDFLDKAELAYVTEEGTILLYRSIYQFNTDGVSLQIRWDCASPGPCPFATNVAQNAECLPLLPTIRERSLQRRTRMSSNPINRRNRQFHRSRRRLD